MIPGLKNSQHRILTFNHSLQWQLNCLNLEAYKNGDMAWDFDNILRTPTTDLKITLMEIYVLEILNFMKRTRRYWYNNE